MKLNSEITAGSRIRVIIERGGLNIRSYTATVIRWGNNGKVYATSDRDGKTKCLSSESIKLIKQ